MHRDTFISLAAYGVICAGLGLAITMALRIWQHRPRTRVSVLDQRIHGLIQDLPEPHFPEGLPPQLKQMFRQEQALGNDVVRLDECRAVEEAWEIIEREMAK